MDDLEYHFKLPELGEMISVANVAHRIGVPRPGAIELLHANVPGHILGDPETPTAYLNKAGLPVATPAAVEALSSVPLRDYPSRPAVNVRVRASRDVGDADREFIGWHASLTHEEQTLSIARWWPRPTRDVIGYDFVTTIAGFVVATGVIRDSGTDRGKVKYDVDWNDVGARAAWAGIRIKTPRGGVVAYLDESS